MPADDNPYDADEDFWVAYLKGRPMVPDSFYERIFDYHAEHSGQFDTVHDAGAGPGVQSERLAKRFKHVIVTDASEENIRNAKRKLGESSEYSFINTKLEDSEGIAAGSVDMVHAGVMLHFTSVNMQQALETVARQLKPGGTFAATYTGLPALRNQEAQLVLDRIHQIGLMSLINKMRASSPETARYGTTLSYYAGNGLKSVRIPEGLFERGIRRLNLNAPDGWSWYKTSIHPDLRHEISSAEDGACYGDSDVVRDEKEGGWEFNTDMDGLRAMASTLAFDHSGEEFQKLWRELEGLTGGKQIAGVWPATLILATKKR